MATNVIINADDLGISPGANQAICEACANGLVTHASLLANGDYFEEAVSTFQRVCPDLILGAHLNLTCGRCLVPSTKLARKDGTFKHDFLGLLLKTPFDKSLLADIEKELDAQLTRLEQNGLVIQHIDSHRHVHMIPGIFQLVKKLSHKHNVSRIRIVNESFFHSFKTVKTLNFFRNGGIVKLFLLNFLSRLNGVGAHKRFFSILYTGEMNREIMKRLLAENRKMEVMVHPGNPDIDTQVVFPNIRFKRFMCTNKRKAEFQACLLPASATGKPGQHNHKT